jgi:hypothetical protein
VLRRMVTGRGLQGGSRLDSFGPDDNGQVRRTVARAISDVASTLWLSDVWFRVYFLGVARLACVILKSYSVAISARPAVHGPPARSLS